MSVWITRAEPGAGATARRLAVRGRRPLVAPVLRIVPLDPAPPIPDAAALAFTSANGVRAFAALCRRRDRPVYAVGAATAAAARAAGFSEVASAEGDVSDLVRLIAAARPDGVVLHACGTERAGDLAGALARAGTAAAGLALYRTSAAAELPPAVHARLRSGDLEAVLVHSPKAARVVASLLAGRADLARLRAVGLSPACLHPLEALGLAELAPAARPDEDALLERLG